MHEWTGEDISYKRAGKEGKNLGTLAFFVTGCQTAADVGKVVDLNNNLSQVLSWCYL